MLNDEQFMREALRLAKRGGLWVHPNPMVGAILVKNGIIIEKGYHKVFGGPHAEIDLLRKAKEAARNGTIYVNLEPCCHFGKTGPCTSALLEAGIKKVVIGDVDPNPLVRGKGMSILRRAGISTKTGILAQECRELNRAYYKFMNTGLPFVSAKIAQTLDGKISRKKGIQTCITGDASLRAAHFLRASHDAVLIGSGTAMVDNPLLTVRLTKGPSPLRVVMDSNLRLSPTLRIFSAEDNARTAVATVNHARGKKYANLENRGVKIIQCDADFRGRIEIRSLLKNLGKMNVSSLLVEGGSEVFASFLSSGLVDIWYWFVAPKVFVNGLPEFTGISSNGSGMAQYNFRLLKVKRLGEDILVEAEIKH